MFFTLSFLLALSTLLFVAREIFFLHSIALTEDTRPFYGSFALLSILTFGAVLFFSAEWHIQMILEDILLIFLPTELLFLGALSFTSQFHGTFVIAAHWYIALVALVFSARWYNRLKQQDPQSVSDEIMPNIPCSEQVRQWFRKQGTFRIIIASLVIAVYAGLGSWHISHFAAVDEPLWTFGRISRFWKGIEKRIWTRTEISDKPGITVAIISGAGLHFETPRDYRVFLTEEKPSNIPLDIKDFLFAFRFPLFLVTVLLLPFFYVFLERLLGPSYGLLSFILIGTAPLTLGMSRIINPDSILWTFAPLSIFSYLAFLRKRHTHFLLLSGIFLGFAILTKYVANIIVVFILGLILFEFLFLSKEERQRPVQFFRASLERYLFLLTIAVLTIFTPYPAAWFKPEELISTTLQSEAFDSSWPFFLGILGFFLADAFVLKSRITAFVLEWFVRIRIYLAALIAGIMLAAISFVLGSATFNFFSFPFEEFLASPKTASSSWGFFPLLSSNFFALVYGIIPIALVGILVALLVSGFRHLRQNVENTFSWSEKTVLALSLFILLYYLGSTVNHVVSIPRYQIIIYPIALVIAGIGLGYILDALRKSSLSQKLETFRPTLLFPIIIFICGVTTLLLATKPLYLAYASSLLPKDRFINVKDMGTGSYEAAEYLNSLPLPEAVSVWSDKSGVCHFFKGACYTGFNFKKLSDKKIDYIVVSSGRESRTTKMVGNAVRVKRTDVIHFEDYYGDTPDEVFRFDTGNRIPDYVKVVPYASRVSDINETVVDKTDIQPSDDEVTDSDPTEDQIDTDTLSDEGDENE